MYEQLQLVGKVIKFPKNDKKKRELKSKLDQAYKLLEIIIESGNDFHIVLDSNGADEVFTGVKRRQVVLTSDYEKAKDMTIVSANTQYFKLEG